MIKKLTIFFMSLIVLFSVACNKKDERKNKVRGGNGRIPTQGQSPSQPGYCNLNGEQYIEAMTALVQSVSGLPKSDIQSSNIDSVARYLFPNVDAGAIQIAKLALAVDTRNPNNSVVVIRLYDEYGLINDDPLQLAMGDGLCGYSVELRINGNQLLIAFQDAIGEIEIAGYISGNILDADVYYYDKYQNTSARHVGRIRLPVQGVIY